MSPPTKQKDTNQVLTAFYSDENAADPQYCEWCSSSTSRRRRGSIGCSRVASGRRRYAKYLIPIVNNTDLPITAQSQLPPAGPTPQHRQLPHPPPRMKSTTPSPPSRSSPIPALLTPSPLLLLPLPQPRPTSAPSPNLSFFSPPASAPPPAYHHIQPSPGKKVLAAYPTTSLVHLHLRF